MLSFRGFTVPPKHDSVKRVTAKAPQLVERMLVQEIQNQERQVAGWQLGSPFFASQQGCNTRLAGQGAGWWPTCW